jgi:hypothetical protein
MPAAEAHGDHAGNFPGLGFLTKNLIDLSLILHGAPPVYFFKAADLPPERRLLQA